MDSLCSCNSFVPPVHFQALVPPPHNRDSIDQCFVHALHGDYIQSCFDMTRQTMQV